MQTNADHITGAIPPKSAPVMSPAGIQPMGELRNRRVLVAVLNVVTYAAMMGLAGYILSHGGWHWLDVVTLTAFAIGLPWTVLGFWNAVIGLTVLHATRSPMKQIAPFAAAGDTALPLASKTAVLMTLRNEDAARAIARLRIVQQSVEATGQDGKFSYFVLSDTNDAEVAAAEEAAIAHWRASVPNAWSERIHYRRRELNTDFKAGNVREFCEEHGRDYEFMLPLDADSLMSGATIVRMVRMMEAHPRLGILQSLVVGMPSTSAFARVFQFGMRHGMRAYTAGQAWWTGECGPFWGHNAVVRIQPFHEQCRLPHLPGAPPLGGPVLSHDQVEATFMRRAGYEVRVLPTEEGSWEENPPTILEFLQRDTRWCQGNLQYIHLLKTPGLYGVSRFQLIWAILMFAGIPAWTLLIALLPALAWVYQSSPGFPSELGIGLYISFFAMYLMPKFAGLIDAALTPGGVKRYGGPLRFVASAAIEFVFSFLQGAISTIRTAVFMIGLLFGTTVNWGGQQRDSYGLKLTQAAAQLWLQTLFGLVICGSLIAINPALFWWSLPLTAGYILAIPFAIITASPTVGRWMARVGLAGIPEDFDPPREISQTATTAQSTKDGALVTVN